MSPPPFANTDRRTRWLRATLLSASFLGLIASAPVWTNTRDFPLLPIFADFPILPAPYDLGLFALMLGALIAAMWVYRPAVITFLSTSFFAYCGDQNRGQPWLYLYWVLLLLSLLPTPTAACRSAIAIVYLWSGLQKINVRFFAVTPEWFVAPAANWHLPAAAMELLKLSVKSAPFVEIAIAVLLWFPRLRRLALVLVLLTHTFALLFLGPLGHNYNWVVWPWNLAMIALVLGLFAEGKFFTETATSREATNSKPKRAPTNATPTRDAFNFKSTFAELRRCRPALGLVALCGMLPILSYSGRWDSYFSFSLYSENLASANLFVTENFRERLPPALKKYVAKFPQAYDPDRQGPLLFSFTAWAYEELHVPPISEPRNFIAIYQALRPYAPAPHDLRMIIGPRSGPVSFHEGDRVEFLQRANP